VHQKFGIPGDLRRLLPFVPRVGAGDKGESGVVLDPAVLERFSNPRITPQVAAAPKVWLRLKRIRMQFKSQKIEVRFHAGA
jgi:hypothetical protein